MNQMEGKLDLDAIKAVSTRIGSFIHKTPIMTSHSLDEISGARLYFKCEHLQVTGAFKFRGAINAVLQLTKAGKRLGVATHSSGNHGAALARAAQLHGLKADVVMPNNATASKRIAVEAYGGVVTECEPTLAAREATLSALVAETGAEIIPPYDDYRIISGQGTVGLELFDQVSDLDSIVVPVGGGGLLSGVSLVSRELDSDVKIYGAEPEMADDAYRSLRSGIRVTEHLPKTMAEGLQTVLGERNFEIIKTRVDDILLVSEQEIAEAMGLIWTRLKQVVEPSSAVTLAAVLRYRELFAGKKVVMVLTGGNVDLNNLPFDNWTAR